MQYKLEGSRNFSQSRSLYALKCFCLLITISSLSIFIFVIIPIVLSEEKELTISSVISLTLGMLKHTIQCYSGAKLSIINKPIYKSYRERSIDSINMIDYNATNTQKRVNDGIDFRIKSQQYVLKPLFCSNLELYAQFMRNRMDESLNFDLKKNKQVEIKEDLLKNKEKIKINETFIKN